MSPSLQCRILLARCPLFRSVADLIHAHQRLILGLCYEGVVFPEEILEGVSGSF